MTGSVKRTATHEMCSAACEDSAWDKLTSESYHYGLFTEGTKQKLVFAFFKEKKETSETLNLSVRTNGNTTFFPSFLFPQKVLSACIRERKCDKSYLVKTINKHSIMNHPFVKQS